MLDNKNILITGGTGTIGTALIKYIVKNYKPNVIRILSRDETKQFELSKKIEKYNENDIFRFFIGDIRDKERIARAMKDIDIVFHLAALKHVNACEYNPFEAIKTNVIGIQNLIEVSIDNNIEKFIFTSSDKAATPSNTMGVTKLLGEKLVSAANYYKGPIKTIFYSIRFGNVMGSRGSLIPLIESQIKKNIPITLTHREMTRYILDIGSALKFLFKTMEFAQGGEVFIYKMEVVKILDLIQVLIKYFTEKNEVAEKNIEIKEIGMFAGEKLYEELFSKEESERTYEVNDMYMILPQLPELFNRIDLTKYENVKKFDINKPFNSKDAPCLPKEQILNYLIKNKII